MILADFECPVHGRFEEMVPSPIPDFVMCDAMEGCPCGLPSRWVPAAIRGSVRAGEVVRGPNEKPPNRLSLDTRKLGEGQSIDEYRAERAKLQQEFRRAEIKDFKEGR